MSATDIAYGATSLCAMPATHVAYGPSSLCTCSAMYGTDILCACSAMCGTDIAFCATSLCTCYAMCGTDKAYGATRPLVLPPEPLVQHVRHPVSSYALATRCPVLTYRMLLSAIPSAYGVAPRCPVLTQRMVLQLLQGHDRPGELSSYALRSTTIAYLPTPALRGVRH
eukprot:1374910-Rhodomonas_salina.2